jgi:hypothetical protein
MRSTFRIAVAALAALLLSVMTARAQQPPANCAPVTAPVCALKNGTRQSYWNECLAARDSAQVIRVGECPNPRSYN